MKNPINFKEIYDYFRLRLKAIEHERDFKILGIVRRIEERQINKIKSEIANSK